MNEYGEILQIIAIFVVVLLFYLLYRLFVSIIRSRRLADYAISSSDDKFNLEFKLWKLINKIGKVLGKIPFLRNVSKRYDKYIKDEEKKYKKGIDFVVIKIILGIIMDVLYIFEIMLHNLTFSFTLFIWMFILGFFVPNIILAFDLKKRKQFIDNDIVKAIVIMSNCYKANMNSSQAIDSVIKKLDGPIVDEFLRVKDDMKHGIDMGSSFYRMYERLKIDSLLYVANVLMLVNKSGINMIEAFDSIEKRLVTDKKEQAEIILIKTTNYVFKNLMYFLPGLLIFLVVLINNDFLNLIFSSNYGFIVVFVEVIIYVVYIGIINRLVRR